MMQTVTSKGKVRIGLEVHTQLTNLQTKLFCGCSTDYRKDPPNTHVCPVCLGLPGSLPSVNKKAIEDAIIVSLALHAQLSRQSFFFRKNYYYPDMSKNFQISQYDKAGGVPIAVTSLTPDTPFQAHGRGKNLVLQFVALLYLVG